MNLLAAPARAVACALLALLPWLAWADDAAALRTRHESLRAALADNPFHRPLVLESTQSASDLRGDVYAVVGQPFGTLAPALQDINHWCDLLILHLNVKGCSTGGTRAHQQLALVVGRKTEQALDEAYKIEFRYSVPVAGADYLRVQMNADAGPLSTRDYRLAFEAVPLDAQHSFAHLSYAYGYGMAARLATQTYLATLGHGKVGFSVASQAGDGKPAFVDGMRGVLERNTMRYFLAIEVYLDALALPAAQQPEKRLRDWFAATERYPAQLHELSADEYLVMKRRELQRQQAMARAAPTD